MRLEVKEGINDSVLINDAYNLDLNSLALALDYLHNVALGRRCTLILSDIAQSGLSDEELVPFMRRDMAAREPYYAQAQLTVDCTVMADDEVVVRILKWLEHGE